MARRSLITYIQTFNFWLIKNVLLKFTNKFFVDNSVFRSESTRKPQYIRAVSSASISKFELCLVSTVVPVKNKTHTSN